MPTDLYLPLSVHQVFELVNQLPPSEKERLRTVLDTADTRNYTPEAIDWNGKHYALQFPLPCKIENEDGVYSIISEMLDIIGTGETLPQAKQNFNQEFDFIFNRYNQLDDAQLSERLLGIKKILNLVVKNVA